MMAKKNNIWLWVGIAAAVAGIGYLAMKKPAGVSASQLRAYIKNEFQASGWLNAGNEASINAMTPAELELIAVYLSDQNSGFTANQLAVAKKYGWWADRWPA